MIPKRHLFLMAMTYWFIGQSCQSVQPAASVEKNSPKRYNWHQRQIHPSFAVVDRDSLGVTIEVSFKTETFAADIPLHLELNAHAIVNDSVVLYHKRFEILPIPSATLGVWKGNIIIPNEADRLIDIVLKFGPNGIADQFYLNWPMRLNGWITPNYVNTKIIASGEKIIRSGNGQTFFAEISDKLPSPPFSSNLPYVPEAYHLIDSDTISTQLGVYLYSLDSLNSIREMIHAIDANVHPQFPEMVTTQELAGPMRYLCSKEEYDKIFKSTDGPENAMEKFWIQSAGGKEKARSLIKTYYQRVWDANHHFTSYAEGWKTDRGMIYVVFGHPEKIELINNLEVWSYLLETGELQFAFELKKHPLWGEIYILKRNEQYRPHWEFQVSQWRQGRIFK